MSERESIAARIRALRAKTVANGCTEGEAMAAAAKAAELLARYNLSVDEVEMRASPFQRHSERHHDLVGARLRKPADGIAHLTGATYWVDDKDGGSEISFFGFDHEVEIARYLLEVCAGAMRRERERIDRQNGLMRSAIRLARAGFFLDGMADRLRERLRALKPPAPTGKGLVVLHDQLVAVGLKDLGVELSDGHAKASKAQEPEYDLGRTAAERVALNQAVRGPAATSGRLAGSR